MSPLQAVAWILSTKIFFKYNLLKTKYLRVPQSALFGKKN